MSQRESDFKGGIQNGTTAFDVESKRLDVYLKETYKSLKEELTDFDCVSQFTKEMKLKYVGNEHALGVAWRYPNHRTFDYRMVLRIG